jgi:hypothetical protein
MPINHHASINNNSTMPSLARRPHNSSIFRYCGSARNGVRFENVVALPAYYDGEIDDSLSDRLVSTTLAANDGAACYIILLHCTNGR